MGLYSVSNESNVKFSTNLYSILGDLALTQKNLLCVNKACEKRKVGSRCMEFI